MKFAQSNNLDWSVREEQVQTVSGLIIDGQKCIIRNDTNKPLSIMANSYQPFQNKELFELLERVSKQTGLEILDSGFFNEGEKVYVQLKSNNLKLGDDKIEGHITGVNSYDGSTSLAFGNSNITISCLNTFFKAFRGLQNKVRHTKNMTIKIDDICRSMDNFLIEEKEIFNNIIQLSETRIGDGDIDSVIRKLFDIDKNISLQDKDAISTITNKKIEQFYVDMNGELKSKGDNLWGLFSSATYYGTHSMNKNGDGNLKNKMFGLQGKREQEIFNHLVELV